METLGEKKVVEVNNGVKSIITERVVIEARKHFDCESLTSVALEDEGGVATANSHWERTILGDESLTGS